MRAATATGMGAYELVDGEESRKIGNVREELERMEEGLVEGGKSLSLGIAAGLKECDGGGGGGRGKKERLASLDVFRGLTVVLMIIVDHLGGVFPSINHSPWNGVTLADFVMPFFLFMVGVSLTLAYKNLTSKIDATLKILLRTMKLFGLGLLLQGGYIHGVGDLSYGVDLTKIRWMGILQRIAIAFLLAALCEIWLKRPGDIKREASVFKKYQFQWMFMVVLSAIYLALLYGLYVSDWSYQVPSHIDGSLTTFTVQCGVRGDTGPACNAVAMVDRKIMGIQHLYKKATYARTEQCSINSPNYGSLPADAPSWCQGPFDPEGILSTVMAVVTCLIGLHYGHIIVHFKDHKVRIIQWMIPSSGFVIMAMLLDICGMHLNKALYSLSYTCLTAGVAGILFSGLYILVDVYGFRRPLTVLEWIGKHALAIFILAACNIVPIVLLGVYWREPQNNILWLIGVRS
ncbi:hypothetical protein QQ045_009160 [Rhodiola kirilowii]